jgi:tubulin alpha
MLSNSTAVIQKFQSLFNKYDTLYDKRAFVHWFVGEGIDDGTFREAR